MNIIEDIYFRAGKAGGGVVGSIMGVGVGVAQAIVLPTYLRLSHNETVTRLTPQFQNIIPYIVAAELSDDPKHNKALGLTLTSSLHVSSTVTRWGAAVAGLLDLVDGDVSNAGWIMVPWALSGLYEAGKATYNHIYNKGVHDAQQGVARP